MKVVDGGGLVVGGTDYGSWPRSAFVARLLGDAAGGSPGVLSMNQQRFLGTEQGAQAVLSVRRTGGSQGAVAVTYATRDFPVPPATGSEHAPGERATGGADYTATTGRLTWADGDVSDREIVVPIASDTNAEQPEFFEVVLESPEGGAGLGAFGADVEIAGASYPAGDFTILRGHAQCDRGQCGFLLGQPQLLQPGRRVRHGAGRGGWQCNAGPGFQKSCGPGLAGRRADVGGRRNGGKQLQVLTVADGVAEQVEAFTLELVSPTGGAALGDATQATVQINVPPSPPKLPPPAPAASGRGGGTFGWLGAMLLGLGGALRRRRIRNR